MSLENSALASNQSSRIYQDVMASRATATTPMHYSRVDPDQTHETVSYWDECAEQLPQARLGQHEEMEPDEDADENEQTVTTWEPAHDSEPSDADRDPLGPRRRPSADPLGALEAALSQHTCVPAPEASTHKPQVLPKGQSERVIRMPGSDDPQVQQRGSQDTGTSLNSPPLFVQHSHKYKERNRKDPHAERLRRIWKEVSDKHRGLRKMEKRAETNRTSLTQAERQKLSPKKKGSKKRALAAESALKEDLPSKHPHQSKQNQKDQQPNQQGPCQPPDPHGNQLRGLRNTPHLQHPNHNPPPHSETTPPPAPTFIPSPIPPANKHIYHHQPPPYSPPHPPTSPTAYRSSNTAASHCQGCKVNLAEIERTTPFRYPEACPLCHTPRAYSPLPQTQPTTPKPILQQRERIQTQAIAPATPIPGAYIPVPDLFDNRSVDAQTIQNKPACMQPGDSPPAFVNWTQRYSPADVHIGMNPCPEAKRANVAEERNGYEGAEVMYLRYEDGVHGIYDDDVDDGMVENESEADDEATVDEEEWEQEPMKRGWEGTNEEDEEVAIRSEDEV